VIHTALLFYGRTSKGRRQEPQTTIGKVKGLGNVWILARRKVGFLLVKAAKRGYKAISWEGRQ